MKEISIKQNKLKKTDFILNMFLKCRINIYDFYGIFKMQKKIIKKKEIMFYYIVKCAGNALA